MGRRFLTSAAAKVYYKPVNPIKLGTVSKQKVISQSLGIETPNHAFSGIDIATKSNVSVFEIGSQQLENMKVACKYAAEILDFGCSLVKPGVTTDEIDVKVHEYALNTLKVYPSPLNYMNFPKSLCTSINDVLCHGIPDDRELIEGDIINLDVSAYKFGNHGDTSRNVRVGKVGEIEDKICIATREALDKSISICKPGLDLHEIAIMCDNVAKSYGFNVDDTFCGHGVGSAFHMQPLVRHSLSAYLEQFETVENIPPFKLVEGLVMTIEPILVAGPIGYRILEDGWTVVSTSGAISAQYEETILITKNGAEILTKI